MNRLTALLLLLCLPAAYAGDYDTALRKGISHFQQLGNHRRAVTALRDAVRLDPSRPEAFTWLGRVHIGARNEQLAVFCYYEALRRTTGDAKALLGELRKLRPQAGLVETLPSKIVAHYFGQAAEDTGSRGGAGSLAAGAPLDERLLLVQGRYGEGRLVDGFKATLTPGEGLKREGGRILAGPEPRRLAWLLVADPARKATTTRVPLRIIGKLARLALRAQHSAVGPGGMLHIGVRGVDAAGNSLYHASYRWSARHGEKNADHLLVRTTSFGLPDFRGESQRTSFKAPAKITDRSVLGRYTVTCRHEPTGVSGTVSFELQEKPVELAYTFPPFTWATDYDAALAAARKEGKPVLVNFYADW